MSQPLKHFLIASDFDQTLSFNDSGQVLSELLGMCDFEERVRGLARTNLVQQGGELSYLIRHDPDFRSVRREHLVEAGRQIRLKSGLHELLAFLREGLPGYRFSFYVLSAAPRELVVSALDGIVPPDHIIGTEFDHDWNTGEVRAINHVTAGHGKVAALDDLAERLGVACDRIVYMGDGSSDVHVMLHVNNGHGFTIAVSEHRQLARIAKCTVLSDNALSVLVPILDQVLGMPIAQIRTALEARALLLEDWAHARIERVVIRQAPPPMALAVA